MRQRGKVSAARLEVVEPVASLHPIPDAPETLAADEAAVWRKLCGQMPANWYRPETHAMLETLCSITVHLGLINAELQKFKGGLPASGGKWKRYRELTRMRGQLAVQIGTLQTKLRMTPQSRYEPSTLARKVRDKTEQPAGKIWEGET